MVIFGEIELGLSSFGFGAHGNSLKIYTNYAITCQLFNEGKLPGKGTCQTGVGLLAKLTRTGEVSHLM